MTRRRKAARAPKVDGGVLLAIISAIAVTGAAPLPDILEELIRQGKPMTRESLEKALRQLERLTDESILETSVAVVCADLHRKGRRIDPIDERPHQWKPWRGM